MVLKLLGNWTEQWRYFLGSRNWDILLHWSTVIGGLDMNRSKQLGIWSMLIHINTHWVSTNMAYYNNATALLSYYSIWPDYDTMAMSDLILENTFFWLEKVALPVQCRPALLNTKTRDRRKNIKNKRRNICLQRYASSCLGSRDSLYSPSVSMHFFGF